LIGEKIEVQGFLVTLPQCLLDPGEESEQEPEAQIKFPDYTLLLLLP
jgi:hypothetical protein